MIEVGKLCVKTAGRDAGRKCVVVDILDNNFVLVDGGTRRKKCNMLHLEPLEQTIKIGKKASHETVQKEFEKLGIEVWQTKPKEKAEKPVKKREADKKEEKKPKDKASKEKKGEKKETSSKKKAVSGSGKKKEGKTESKSSETKSKK